MLPWFQSVPRFLNFSELTWPDLGQPVKAVNISWKYRFYFAGRGCFRYKEQVQQVAGFRRCVSGHLPHHGSSVALRTSPASPYFSDPLP
jgi:hypothetical protein